MKCPFVYANGKQCSGYIKEAEFIKADVTAYLDENDWVTGLSMMNRYHIHLVCSEKGNHAGYRGQDSDQMKVWGLPRQIMSQILERDG